MNDNLISKVSDEAQSPAFLVGAVMYSTVYLAQNLIRRTKK